MGRGVGVTGGFLITGVPRGVGGGVSVGQVSEGAVGSTSTVGGSGVCSGKARVGIGDCSDPGWQLTSPRSKAQARISALGAKCCFISASLGKERRRTHDKCTIKSSGGIVSNALSFRPVALVAGTLDVRRSLFTVDCSPLTVPRHVYICSLTPRANVLY